MTKRKLTLLAAVSAVGISLAGAVTNDAAAQNADPVLPELEWDTGLKKFQFDQDKFIGQRFSAVCPPRSVRDEVESIFGTDVYPSKNPICVAALHAGTITTDGGPVTVQLNPGEESYTGSSRNGIDSGNLPGTPRSMVFVDATDATAANEARAPYIERLKWDFRFTDSGYARKDLVGQRFTFNCPAAPGDLRLRRVVGTDSYAHNSIVCQAAVHAGKITMEEGGIVEVQLDPGIKRLVGSIRNGIETNDGSGNPRSISFVDTAAAPSPAVQN